METIFFRSLEKALEQGFVHNAFFPRGHPAGRGGEEQSTVRKALFKGLFKGVEKDFSDRIYTRNMHIYLYMLLSFKTVAF